MTETILTKKQNKIRSDQQRKSIEVYCRLLAEKLTEAGISYKKFLELMDDVDNTQETVKAVFREYGRTQYRKNSTTKLTTKECQYIYDEFTRNTGKIGIYVPWPSIENTKEYLESLEK